MHVARRPRIEVGDEWQAGVVGEGLRGDPALKFAHRRPRCLVMAAEVVVADDVAPALKEPAPGVAERLAEVGAFVDFVWCVLEQGGADRRRDQRCVVVHGILRVRQAAGEFILIVTAVHVGDLQELADVIFAVGTARALFGTGQAGQEQCGEYGDDRDHHQQLDQREAIASGQAHSLWSRKNC